MNSFKRLFGVKGIIAIFAIALLLIGTLAMAKTEEKAKKGFLGVGIENLSPDDMKEFGADFGVLVTNVEKGEAAEKAGIKKHDVIQYLGDEKILKTDDLIAAVREAKAGAAVKIKLVRDGKPLEVTATLGELKSEFSWNIPEIGKEIDIHFGNKGGYLGVQLLELNEDLAGYFGVKTGEGVLILQVEDDSPAKKAGLKSGDVIIELDGKKVGDPGKVTKVVSAYEKGDEIEIKFIRHNKAGNIKVTLGEHTGFGNPGIFKGRYFPKGAGMVFMPSIETGRCPGFKHRIVIPKIDVKLDDKIKKEIKEKIEEVKKKAKEIKIKKVVNI